MKPMRSQLTSLAGLLIVSLVLSPMIGQRLGYAQEGEPGGGAYPAPESEPQPVVWNAGWETTGMQVGYNKLDGGACDNSVSNSSVSPYYSWVIASPPGGCTPVISAIIRRTNVTHGYLDGIVNQVLPSTYNAAQYRLVSNPSKTVTIPFWYNGLDGWTSGMAIQNVNNQSVVVSVSYYWSNYGVHSTASYSLAPYETKILSNTPGPFTGTVRVTASLPVAVVTNYMRSAYDGAMSTAALHK